MSISVVLGILQRYLYLYTRNPLRWFELCFWPIMNITIWGFLTSYLMDVGEYDKGLSSVTFLLGGVLLWDIQFRATQGVSISFLEDVWTRNLLNMFVAPVRTREMVAGMCLVGLLRVSITLPLLTLMAFLAFQFNVFQLDLWLLPFFGCLMIFGWALGMIANCLVMRWGQSAEGLSWAVPFMIQPFSAVFYPVEILPSWLQGVSAAIPSSHVFEGMRAVLNGETPIWGHLGWALAMNVVWLIVASLIMMRVLRVAREKALLVRVATQ